MKRIILTLFVGGLVLTSCKKDLTCECAVTNTYIISGGGESLSNTSNANQKTEFKGVTKKAVNNSMSCASYTTTYTESEVVGGVTITDSDVTTYDCKLAK
jgi:hypothetical protein